MRRILLTSLILLAYLIPSAVTASPDSSILPPVSLKVGLDDLDTIIFYFSESSFNSFSDAAELKSNRKELVGANKTIPITAAKMLLESLKDMYPSPEALTLLRWTDDYPYEQITIKLTDGRQIVAISTSQFPKAVPWNIRVWQGDPNKGGELIGSYVLLNYEFHAGASEIWNQLTEKSFPRAYGFDQFYWSEDEKQPTIEFYVSHPYDGFQNYGNEISVDKREPEAVLRPFSSILKANPELSAILGKGYTLFDAAFSITVDVNSLTPIRYSGMLALEAPDSPDVIVTTVEISGTNSIEVQTPLTLTRIEEAISHRKELDKLQHFTNFLPGGVFIHDLRSTKPNDFTNLSCAEDIQYSKSDYRAELLLTANNNQKIIFYHLPEKNAWTVDGNFGRENGTWNNKIIQTVLQTWFPPSFISLDPESLENLNLNFGVAFRPGFIQRQSELPSGLKEVFPAKSNIHIAHPQKEGDKSFIYLEGRLIIPEGNGVPQIVYCGHERPSWYGPKYKVSEVKRPDPNASQYNFRSVWARQEGWTVPYGLPDGNTEVTWTTFTSSKPGYIHLLWTIDKKGVYYSEGWADGTGWLQPQRLGDETWNMQAVSNSNGEVHLLWSTDYDPVGSMHVWRNAEGEWQKPEYWEGIGYFSDVLLDDIGNLHLAWSQSDGWDEEYFYSIWNSKTGISEPENVSRRLGDLGNTPIILRLDASNKIHAVWGHPLNKQQYIDPLSGEAFDTSGLFYSVRIGLNNWTLPEQIGTFAPFSSKVGFDLLEDTTPVVVWQSTEGIVASDRSTNEWTSPVLLQNVIPPEDPDPFGPGRWVLGTAEIELQENNSGQLNAIWLDAFSGIYLSTFEVSKWSNPQQIKMGNGLSSLSTQIGSDGSIHAIYFDTNGGLQHLKYSNSESVETSMSMRYDGYGVDVASMEVDSAGFVYVLGLPRRPHWKVFIPSQGISLIPTPVPSATFTPRLTKTITPTITPTITKTPIASLTPTPQYSRLTSSYPSIAIAGIFVVVIIILILILRLKNRRFQ